MGGDAENGGDEGCWEEGWSHCVVFGRLRWDWDLSDEL